MHAVLPVPCSAGVQRCHTFSSGLKMWPPLSFRLQRFALGPRKEHSVTGCCRRTPVPCTLPFAENFTPCAHPSDLPGERVQAASQGSCPEQHLCWAWLWSTRFQGYVLQKGSWPLAFRILLWWLCRVSVGDCSCLRLETGILLRRASSPARALSTGEGPVGAWGMPAWTGPAVSLYHGLKRPLFQCLFFSPESSVMG